MARKHEDVVRAIVRDAAGGRLPAGAWLPRERDLAARHGVSRGVAREAVRALEERRVLGVRHGRGQFIRPEDEWDLLDAAILPELIARPRRLADALEMRRTVAGRAAALAAAARDDARTLGAVVAELRAARAPDPFVRAELRFHARLAEASGNRLFAQALEPVDLALALARQRLRRPRQRAVTGHYADVASAVAAGDAAGAMAAVATHVDALAGWLGVSDSITGMMRT